jgi:hypothetical protein
MQLLSIVTDTRKTVQAAKTQKAAKKLGKEKVLDDSFTVDSNGTTIAGEIGVF